jgi:RHS repeat-associated protein
VAQYDRGIGAVTQAIDLHGELTTASYDAFGRIATLTRPDPNNVGLVSAVPSVQIQYLLPTDATQTPYSVMMTGVQDGANPGDASYRQVIAMVDGLGRSILTAEEADPSAGDAGAWIFEKLTTYDGKGAAGIVYQPWFSDVPPPLPTIAPRGAYSRARFDAFGRGLEAYGLDGAITLRNVYHALSSDHWDAADLEAGGAHAGTFASEMHDGHGRTVAVTERVHKGTAIEAHDTRTQYRPTGEPTTISRVRVGLSDAPVVRWFQYDSLGRMVLNVEPDTTTGYTNTPSTLPATTHTWRYAYDDNGDLVGTSDARGCGTNYHYDAGGRIVAEDFSPCLASQQVYSPPNLTTGDGTEAFYQYDGYDDVELPPTGTAGFPPAPLGLGRLVAVSDRGAKTVTSYDGRGRTIAVARLVAGPAGPSNSLADRYAPTWSARTVDYDGADRPVNASTGVDVGALLPGGSSPSTVTTQYSRRGTVSSVSSTYGPLVAAVGRDADGLMNQVVYGDVAGTTSALTYDVRRRLASVQTYRGPPASWSQSPPAYAPAPTPSGPPSTFQLLLEDADYHYDVVDNPVEIDDWRVATEWPAGAQPVSHKIAYDDLYRATRVDYVYPNGTDPWTSPFAAEDTGSVPDPRLARPSPHVSFVNRTSQQSFQYDWLGNTTATDDDVHGFYDRSLGAVTNGTASAGPYQITGATGGGQRGGTLTASYDSAGELTSLAVNRAGPCLPAVSFCSQRFVYDWDEVGRLARARRWDLASAGSASDAVPAGTADTDLRYTYDASDGRVLKEATDTGGTRAFTAYIFPSLELRRTADQGNDYVRDATTEVAYLDVHGVRLARLQATDETVPALSGQTRNVFLEIPDHLGSTSIVVDRDTSEVVERGTYMAYGQAESDYRPPRWSSFREDYRFTGKEEDAEVGLQYFGKRYYAAGLNRWISADPLAIHGLGADLNVYAYVHGSILQSTDPTGLDEIPGGAAPGPTGGTVKEYEAPNTTDQDAKNDPNAGTLQIAEITIHGDLPARSHATSASIVGSLFPAMTTGATRGLPTGLDSDSRYQAWSNVVSGAGQEAASGGAHGTLLGTAMAGSVAASGPVALYGGTGATLAGGGLTELGIQVAARAPAATTVAGAVGAVARGLNGDPEVGAAAKAVPRISVAEDSMAIWAKVAGDPKAFARLVREPGALHVTDVFRGAQGPGSGSQILAAGLKAGGMSPGQQLVFKNIINEETLAAYRAGASASSSLLGRLGSKALGQLGLEASSFEFQVVRGKLDLVIGVK